MIDLFKKFFNALFGSQYVINVNGTGRYYRRGQYCNNYADRNELWLELDVDIVIANLRTGKKYDFGETNLSILLYSEIQSVKFHQKAIRLLSEEGERELIKRIQEGLVRRLNSKIELKNYSDVVHSGELDSLLNKPVEFNMKMRTNGLKIK